MILLEKLALRNFGKYSSAAFDFGETTVFRGDNETGKTTIFDALFKTMSDVDGRANELSRYEDTRGIESQWTNDAKPSARTMGKSEFLSLYAIRAGDVTFDLKPGASWIQQVTAKLFAGGITPAEVNEVLNKHYASTGKAQQYMKAITPLEHDLKIWKDKLAEAENEKEHLLQEEKSNNTSKQRLKEVEQTMANLNKDIKTLASEISKDEKVVQRADCTETLTLILRINQTREGLKKMLAVEKDENAVLKQLDQALRDAQGKEQQAVGLRDQRYEDQKNVTAKIAEKETSLSKKKTLSETAERLIRELNEADESEPGVLWNIPALILGFILLAAGCTLSTLFLPGIFRWVGIGASVVVAGALILIAKGKETQTAGRPITAVINRIKDEWMTASGDTIIKEIAGKIGLSTFLNKHISEYEAEKNLLGTLEQDKKIIAAAIEQHTAAIEQTRTQIKTKKDELETWFKNHEVANADQYHEARQEYTSCRALLDNYEKQARERTIDDLEKADARCRGILKNLDEQGIPETGCTKEELALKRKQHSKMLDVLSTHQSEQKGLIATTNKSEGGFAAHIDNCNQKIITLRKSIAETTAKAEGLKLDHEAAKTAMEIFTQIESDNQDKLEGLSNEISAVLSAVTPSAGTVKIDALDSKQLSCADAGGTVRPLSDLSSGEQDTFFFAARLALAKKHADGPRILVLDEPFTALDETRESRMVDLLRDFQQQNNWQVILFTKEKRLAQTMKDQCGAKLYEFENGKWEAKP